MTDRLHRCLEAAARGDARAAFVAAHLLEGEGESVVLVQTQLRRAAEGGYAIAQRELAVLGLCDKLCDSGVTACCAARDAQSQGLYWLKRAAAAEDTAAMLLLACCYRHGLYGVPCSETKAERLLQICAATVTPEHFLQHVAVISMVECLQQRGSVGSLLYSFSHLDFDERRAS